MDLRVSGGPVSELTVSDYLQQVASDRPVPGGGSAAALAGAMGAALLAMVARVSMKKAKGAEIQAELEVLAPEGDRLVDRLLQLAQDDIDAYGAVVQARRSVREQGADEAAIRVAAEGAARVPLSTATLARRGLDMLDQLRPMASPLVASDVDTAQGLLRAAFDGALANVAINLPDLEPAAQEQLRRAYEALRAAGPRAGRG
jgi:formiminotetrahydrofolate cyclodeaminase